MTVRMTSDLGVWDGVFGVSGRGCGGCDETGGWRDCGSCGAKGRHGHSQGVRVTELGGAAVGCCRNGREAGNREGRKGPPDVSWVPGAGRVEKGGRWLVAFPRRGLARGCGLQSKGQQDPGRVGGGARFVCRGPAPLRDVLSGRAWRRSHREGRGGCARAH